MRCRAALAFAVLPACAAGTAPGTLTVGPVPSEFPSSVHKKYTQHVYVFGVNVFGEKSMPAEKVLHAANVIAQYLDSDGDGKCDNQKVCDALVQQGSEQHMCYGLEKGEIFPDMCAPGGKNANNKDCFDATIEECFHYLSDNGWAAVYPEIFGCNIPRTSKYAPPYSKMMDTLIDLVGDCGWAYNRTYKYPKCSGTYHYDDRTCDPSCMMSEYTYWTVTSVLGYQCDPFCEKEDGRARIGPKNRCNEVDDEWTMCTKKRMQEKDAAAYAIVTDPQYGMPKVMPSPKGYQGTAPPFKYVKPQPKKIACGDDVEQLLRAQRRRARRNAVRRNATL